MHRPRSAATTDVTSTTAVTPSLSAATTAPVLAPRLVVLFHAPSQAFVPLILTAPASTKTTHTLHFDFYNGLNRPFSSFPSFPSLSYPSFCSSIHSLPHSLLSLFFFLFFLDLNFFFFPPPHLQNRTRRSSASLSRTLLSRLLCVTFPRPLPTRVSFHFLCPETSRVDHLSFPPKKNSLAHTHTRAHTLSSLCSICASQAVREDAVLHLLRRPLQASP